MEKQLTIAIDFDGTFAANPALWRNFITDAQNIWGYQIVCVTGRSDEGEWGKEVKEAIDGLIPIVFAGHRWKREAAQAAGYEVNIWIDDNPEYIAPQNLIGVTKV